MTPRVHEFETTREAREALGEPPIEYLSIYVSVTFRRIYGGNVTENPYVRTLIDRYGYVQIQASGATNEARFARQQEDLDFLMENEIVEWRRIGPEDSEPFLTDEWEKRLAPQLAALHDWRREETASG